MEEAIVFFLVIFAFIAGFIIGSDNAEKRVRDEIVSRGGAEYVKGDDGSVAFRYLLPKKVEKQE
jgi:hypothetical protein